MYNYMVAIQESKFEKIYFYGPFDVREEAEE